jgi:hypothetical protein
MVIKAPNNINQRDIHKPSMFLAGSIEMGQAENWQDTMTKYFEKDFNIFNPRRDNWDSSWVQSFDNPEFFQQVSWELHALDFSDIIIMYFDPKTMSPISLLELGLYATSKKLHVICPEGFWRKGNIEIVCSKYNIPLYNSIEEFKNKFK